MTTKNSDSKIIIGLTTRFKNIDALTRGFQKSDLIILAARPSMGKTTLAGNIVDNVIMRGDSVAIFSLEMEKKQILTRMLAKHSMVNGNRLLRKLFYLYQPLQTYSVSITRLRSSLKGLKPI